MSSDQVRRPLGRRSLLGALGGAGALLALRDRRPPGAPPLDVAAQSTPTAEWTPQPLPKPLTQPSGTPPPVVGPALNAAPATSMENPSASPVADQLQQVQVESPGQPPQPMASPAASPVAAAGPAPSATVELTPDFTFSPDKVSIKTGQAVRWVNQGRSPQTVTCDPARAQDKSLVQLPSGAQPWDSGVLNWGENFDHVFDTPGTYGYFSMPQEQKPMAGQVEVTS
ncbi:MAG TPA: plastocyanin/azurin family copper-binding protein [Thermomicrobiales bacterium]|nr:plastocyanin/azurin family copper-binding protein [Thermomicrobiales bacterium]